MGSPRPCRQPDQGVAGPDRGGVRTFSHVSLPGGSGSVPDGQKPRCFCGHGHAKAAARRAVSCAFTFRVTWRDSRGRDSGTSEWDTRAACRRGGPGSPKSAHQEEGAVASEGAHLRARRHSGGGAVVCRSIGQPAPGVGQRRRSNWFRVTQGPAGATERPDIGSGCRTLHRRRLTQLARHGPGDDRAGRQPSPAVSPFCAVLRRPSDGPTDAAKLQAFLARLAVTSTSDSGITYPPGSANGVGTRHKRPRGPPRPLTGVTSFGKQPQSQTVGALPLARIKCGRAL